MQTKSEHGFTIVEMIVVIGLMAMLMVVLSQLFLVSHQLYRTQNAELRVNNSVRRSLDEIDAFVRQATQVVDSYSTHTTGSTTLVMEVQSISSTNQLIPGTYDTVIFYYSGNKIYRQIVPGAGSFRPGTTVLLAENVTALDFGYDNNFMPLVRKVTTNITVSEVFARETQSLSASSSSTLRN